MRTSGSSSRVNDFFYFDNAWRTVVSHLARSSDEVLVDVRGFGRQNAGVVFELTTWSTSYDSNAS
jgi:hypothetical protein